MKRDETYAMKRSGYLALGKHDLKTARRAFEKALAALPDDGEILVGLVRTYIEAGELDLARSKLVRLDKILPRSAEVSILKGELALVMNNPRRALTEVGGLPGPLPSVIRGYSSYKLGLFGEAVDHFGSALSFGEDARAFLGEGLALKGLGRLDEAVISLKRAAALPDTKFALEAAMALAEWAIEKGDARAAVHYGKRALLIGGWERAGKILAEAFLAAGMREKALDAWRTVLKASPDDVRALSGAAEILIEDDPAAAEDLLVRLIRADPLNIRARLSLGSLYLDSGRRKEALELFEEAVHIEPNYPDTHLFLAEVLHEKGDIGRALDEYLSFLEISQDHPGRENAFFRAGDIYMDLLDEGCGGEVLAAAENHFRAALDECPGEPILLSRLGGILAARGFKEEGLAHIERAFEADPTSAEIHFERGRILVESGDERGLRGMESARDLDPHPFYTMGLAEAYCRFERWKEAEREFRRALAADTSNPTAMAGLAFALSRSGRLERALENWNRFISRYGSSEEAVISRAEVLIILGRTIEARKGLKRLMNRRTGEARTSSRFLAGIALIREGKARGKAAILKALNEDPALPRKFDLIMAEASSWPLPGGGSLGDLIADL